MNSITEVDINDYPNSLKDLSKFPKRLRVSGDYKEDLFSRCIGVVGSRKISKKGEVVCREVVSDLVARKYVVVSGLAIGTDSIAHKTCIDRGGQTIAVLGSGIENIYPRENRSLAEEIVRKGGLLMSEYGDDFGGSAWSFPQRNRIVAALSKKGLIVIEAELSSGTMITVKDAKKLGRKVWVWEGSTCEGNKYLLKEKLGEGFLKSDQIKDL